METDMQLRYTAAVIAEERIQDHHREPIKLTRATKTPRIFRSLAKLFH